MTKKYLFFALLAALAVQCRSKRCDQTPPQATILEPSENNEMFKMTIETKMTSLYMPEQTYLVSLIAMKTDHPFRWFMITAEDPTVDNKTYAIASGPGDVGSLKTLDTDTGKKTRYSDRCFNSVESTDFSDKYRVDIHWISPKSSRKSQRVRLRAMVAENNEVWYMDDEALTLILEKDDRPPIDSPPTTPVETCTLCSEARYEVIFYGKWSRVSHPQYYPNKPDTNGYTHMVGASHDNDFVLWRKDQAASLGLKELVEDASTEELEREIIRKMDIESGTRTLIRGKRRHHPYMFEPSHSLFRVDRFHHRFSMVVGMRPSPDWFLGTSHFELCTADGWLKEAEIPLYPWDAGTMDGVSYESARQVTLPTDKVKRVDVGSFNKASPFYQMNLNDLKPFALLQVRLLDVYPLVGESCNEEAKEGEEAAKEQPGVKEEEAQDEPNVAESKLGSGQDSCSMVWSAWSECEPLYGTCGRGIQVRTRETRMRTPDYEQDEDLRVMSLSDGCYGEEAATTEKQYCYVEC